MQSEFREGDVIGAYRVEGVVGSGGMGTVYRAHHALSERVVAVKVQRSDTQLGAQARERMLREAQILATLPHAGVPRFHEVGLLDDDRPWIAMELVDGTCLATRLRSGRIDGAQAQAIVLAISSVLAEAHARGITHRDLKPDNIYLTPTGAYPVRVLDWGIALDQTNVRLTNHDEAIGTPTYMAPEQARGGPTGGHCDVYALGVIAYHMLAGTPPFEGNTPVEILLQHFNRQLPALAPRCPDVAYGLVEVVERMLAKRYDLRPAACEIDHELNGAARRSAPYDTYDLGDPVETISTEAVTSRIRIRG
ncbi:MAG: serine/threonine-protein kinase [Kofleriaceae bacterium]